MSRKEGREEGKEEGREGEMDVNKLVGSRKMGGWWGECTDEDEEKGNRFKEKVCMR